MASKKETEAQPMDVDEKDKKNDSKKGDVKLEEAELSEEDKALKEKLERHVTELEDESKLKEALTEMRTAICAATSTMTSVPKPLKFLRPHYAVVKARYDTIEDKETQKLCADVVSLLGMIEEGHDCINYRLKGTDETLSTFGHEYIRHLAGQISEEYYPLTQAKTDKAAQDIVAILKLVEQIIPFLMDSNAEAEACDLAMEVERLDLLLLSCHIKGYTRVCLYLMSCIPFVPEPQDDALKRICLAIFKKFEQWPQAMQMALKLNEPEIIQEVFFAPADGAVRRQLAFMLARQGVVLDLDELVEDNTNPQAVLLEEDELEREFLVGLMSNQRLNENFLALGRELDILEPKTPEDVYKTHLDPAGRQTAKLDSAKANLASTFVNAFVNCGFGKDKLITQQAQSKTSWINRNKERGQFSAAASLGMILMWDVSGGLQKIDPYLLSDLDDVKAGAMLGVGIVTSGVADENDPAFALLAEYVCHEKSIFRVGSVMALGLAYAGAGSTKPNVATKLCEALADPSSNMEVIGTTCVALGEMFVGTCDGDITEAIITLLMEKTEEELAGHHGKQAALGLGLLYLGKQKAAEVAMQGLVALPETFQKVAKMLLDTCAYAGTGNVLKIQSLLHSCSEHVDVEEESFKQGDDAYQAFATLGVALVAMGEETGVEMVMRMFNHLLRYGELVIRRVVPLAIALLYTSNPKLPVLDTLSKLSHDADATTAHSAILAIGLVGAGTNHARIASMLRLLGQYYNKDEKTLFLVRLAQGMVHTGKGSISLTPFHTERTLMSPSGVAGLLAFLVSAMDMEDVILKDGHHMMFHLVLAMYPRILCTFTDDDDLTAINTSVRVGQAVDVVGQAGKPKTITGFVTNNTPVLLSYGERAQLATEEFLPVTPLLEGFVILKKNPDYDP
eukprot:m.211071 g.211071  ORF g.211071 m.211071 type:complete len:905 (-) comp33103_c0_seq1:362-3076(-)